MKIYLAGPYSHKKAMMYLESIIKLVEVQRRKENP